MIQAVYKFTMPYVAMHGTTYVSMFHIFMYTPHLIYFYEFSDIISLLKQNKHISKLLASYVIMHLVVTD